MSRQHADPGSTPQDEDGRRTRGPAPQAGAVPPAATKRIRVLYIDYSVGFGGATKSISLVFRGLGDVEKFVLTSQRRELISRWYEDATVYRFRSAVNYQLLGRLREWARSALPLRLVLAVAQKGLAVVDVVVGGYHCLRILRIVRRHRIHVIHLNNAFIPAEGLLAARLAGIPCIVHLRGFLSWHGLGRTATYRRVARTVTVSNAVATSLGSTSIPPWRIVTIYDPVDIERFASVADQRNPTRARLGIEPGDVAVGIFGRVIAWKGQMEFVQAALKAMRVEPRLKAVIVGDESDGGPEYFEKIKGVIRDSGCADRFVLTGYQPRVAELYHAVDVVVHASIEPEPFGMVVPEAMAAGKPIIAADSGGPREVVEHGVDGLLVRARDVVAMADAMVVLARDAAMRRAMGERGYAKAVHRFGIPRIAAEVRRVYEEVLG